MLRFLALFLAMFLAAVAQADEPCRIAFDMGSSGLRVGSDATPGVARADIDYLADLWADRHLDETVAATVAALRRLPDEAGLGRDCLRVGGGMSAWRLALTMETPAALATTLATLYAHGATAVLVIPQQVEGRYGHLAARRALGERLVTSHILDIGGGSLQVAGAVHSWGDALGQKVWHKLLCRELRQSAATPCALQPLSAAELLRARELAAWRLAELRPAVGAGASLTAISRPVSRGVFPALRRLQRAGALPEGAVDGGGFTVAALSAAVDHLAAVDRDQTAVAVAAAPAFAQYLLSDMLLVEGVLRATGAGRLEVAELDITNIPGLLSDDRAYAWAARYGCYLERLQTRGVAAYDSDPETCP